MREVPSQGVSKQTLQRLPVYLSYLKGLREAPKYISATAIAEALNMNHVVVRKDLASISSSGRPKVGYVREELLAYDGFVEYGLNILAGFDTDPFTVNTEVGGKMILPMDRLEDLCQRMKVRIGILTVPGEHAQAVCNLLIKSGILAVWNFSNVHLDVPEGILVQNENMAVSLAILSNHLKERFSTK